MEDAIILGDSDPQRTIRWQGWTASPHEPNHWAPSLSHVQIFGYLFFDAQNPLHHDGFFRHSLNCIFIIFLCGFLYGLEGKRHFHVTIVCSSIHSSPSPCRPRVILGSVAMMILLHSTRGLWRLASSIKKFQGHPRNDFSYPANRRSDCLPLIHLPLIMAQM